VVVAVVGRAAEGCKEGKDMLTDHELMAIRVHALFTHDANGRLVLVITCCEFSGEQCLFSFARVEV
jgi:hypothetical protein